MRSYKEIEEAISYLKDQDDLCKKVQLETLKQRLTEKDVFQKYVVDVPEEERNEDVFYAARDAAQFMYAKIGLAELIPEADVEDDSQINEDETITLTRGEYMSILKRLEQLEITLRIRSKKDYTAPIKVKKLTDDLVTQDEAAETIGYSIRSIRRWNSLGYLKKYKFQTRVYYSKKELEEVAELSFKNRYNHGKFE